MKKILVLTLILAIAATSVFAANARKGKRVWKKSCRLVCHDGSKPGVSALSPVEKTQGQWKELFANDHAAIKDVHKKGELDKVKNVSDWEDMFLYLFDHALDSDQPETCG